MYSNAVLILIGDELLSGRTRDVNLYRFSNILSNYGLPVVECLIVRDNQLDIEKALLNNLSENRVIIVTGGLGPTDDDITLRSVAGALELPVIRSIEAERMVKSKYLDKTTISDSALTQADIPETAEVVNNPVGIAPGVLLKTGNTAIICLPGVPSESIALLELCLLKTGIQQKSAELPLFVRTWGLKENPLYDSLKSMTKQFNADLAFLPSPGRVDIKVSGEEAEGLVQAIKVKLKNHVYSSNRDETLETVLVRKLIQKKATLSTAESCTGGGIGAALTQIPGVSACYLGGVVTYSNEMKVRLLGVSENTLSTFGAVSKETALAMAKGIREKINSDYALSVTGIAGPDGGTKEKPVGTVWSALVSKNVEISFCWFLGGAREQVRQGAISRALGTLFEALA